MDELKKCVLEHRQQRLKTDKGEIQSGMLFRKKNRTQLTCETNLMKIKETSQLQEDDELYLSFKMDEQLKYKPAKRNKNKINSSIKEERN